MAYTPTTWTDNTTQANAARLNKLEQGVKDAHDLAESGTSGTVTSVNGVEPDESGNVVIPVGGGGGGAGLTEDPDHPGLYLIDQVQTVTPAAPTFTDEDGTANDRYTIPATTGVQYVAAGSIRSAGTYTPTAGQTVNVVAQALPGYQIEGTTSWSYTFSTGTAPIQVAPDAPTADDSTDTITWTPTTGVDYVIGGTVRTPPYSVGDVDASVTVNAVAQEGYSLTGTTSWVFEFTQAPSTPASDYSAAVIADAPVVFYKLNEAGGTTPVDSMANSTAVVQGTVALGSTPIITGATSAEISTAGTGANAIVIGTPAALSGISTWTAEVIIRATGGATGILNRGDGNTDYVSMRHDATPALQVKMGPTTTFDTVGFAWATPVHVAATHDGATLRFYINGVETHSVASTATIGTNAAIPWEIGRQDSYDGGRNSFRGRMSGVAIYNKTLSAARVLAHAQAAGLAD